MHQQQLLREAARRLRRRSPPAQAHALTVFRRPILGASPRLSSAFELPAVVGALGYSLSPVQVICCYLIFAVAMSAALFQAAFKCKLLCYYAKGISWCWSARH